MRITNFQFPVLLVCTTLLLIYQLFTRVFANAASAKPVTRCKFYFAIYTSVEVLVHRLKPPRVCHAILGGEQIVHLRGLLQAFPIGEEPESQTHSIVGSPAKSFTAMAVMQLVKTGQVKLDALVQHSLPWFQMANRQVIRCSLSPYQIEKFLP